MIPRVKQLFKIGSKEPTMQEEVWFKQGKNLFNGFYQEGYGYNQTNGGLNVVADVYSSVNAIKLLEGKTNIVCSKNGTQITTRFFFYDENMNFLSTLVAGSVLATIPENAKYCHFQVATAMVEYDMSKIQIEYDEVTSFEEYIEPTIYVKNSSGGYNEFVKEETVKKYFYTLKGLTITVIKRGKMVTFTITGATNEVLSKNTFYDLTIDGSLRPLIQVDDTFLLGDGAGMIRITTAGVFRLYPWTELATGVGVRYTVTYICV